MRTELLTFETTVRVTYDPSIPGVRPFAIKAARDVMGDLVGEVRASVVAGVVTIAPVRSIYRPKVVKGTKARRT